MLEPIRKDLEKAVLDLRALVRDPGSSIPLWSWQRWDVQTANGERVMNLEHPIEKDYEKFLYYQIESLLQRDSVKSLVTSIEEHAVIREALCLKPNEVRQEVTWDYLLPMTAAVLKREDAGDQIAEAIGKIFADLDAAVREPMYTVKYFAPLRHFSCTEDELELTDGIYIRRIPNDEMAGHLNAIATYTNFSDFQELQFQLEAVEQIKRASPRMGAVSGTFQTLFSEIEEALRVLKVGAVGSLFYRVQAPGFFGSGQSATVYSTGVRLYGEKETFIYKFSKEDIPNLINVHKGLKSLRTNARFAIALRRFGGAYTKPMGDDRVLDYWIALEALVLPDGKEGELRTKAALRLAWLLGTNADRAEIFKNVQKSYNLRSSIAHGTQHHAKPEDVAYLEGLVRQTMLHCLERREVPEPDWLNRLVLNVL